MSPSDGDNYGTTSSPKKRSVRADRIEIAQMTSDKDKNGRGAAASHSPQNAAQGMTRGATVNAASPSRSTTVNAWY